MHAAIRKSAFFVSLIAIGVVSLLPREVLPETGISDKLGHFAAYGALALLAWLAYAEETIRRRIMIALVLYGAVLEGLQSFIPGRFFSIGDMIANGGGVALVYAALMVIGRRRIVGLPGSRTD